MSQKRKSLFSFAENIYDLGKKIIEDNDLSEPNSSSQPESKTNDDSSIVLASLDKSNNRPNYHSESSLIENKSLDILHPSSSLGIPKSIEDSPNPTPCDNTINQTIEMYDSLKAAQSCLSSTEIYLKMMPTVVKYLKENNGNMCNDQYLNHDLNALFLLCELYDHTNNNLLTFSTLGIINSMEKENKLINEIHNLKKVSDIDKKHISKLDDTLNQVLEQNKNLELKKNSFEARYTEAVSVINKQKNQLDIIARELSETNTSLINLNKLTTAKDAEISRLQATVDELRSTTQNLQRRAEIEVDLERLKSHLIEVEEQHAIKTTRDEEIKLKLETQIQNMSLDLNRTKIALQEGKTNYDRHSKVLSEQLLHLNQERDKLVSEIIDLTKTIELQRTTIEALEYNLAETEMNYKSQIETLQETHQSDICKSIESIQSEKDHSIDSIKNDLILHYEEILSDLRQQLNHSKTEFQNISNKQESVSDILQPTADENNLDKILLQNLIIAYQKVNNEHKTYVWRVICSVLGVEPVDSSSQSLTYQTLSWIPGLNRWFTSSEFTQHGPSLSELFVDYLETESKKNTNPYVPPISTDELKKLISRHQSSE